LTWERTSKLERQPREGIGSAHCGPPDVRLLKHRTHHPWRRGERQGKNV